MNAFVAVRRPEGHAKTGQGLHKAELVKRDYGTYPVGQLANGLSQLFEVSMVEIVQPNHGPEIVLDVELHAGYPPR